MQRTRGRETRRSVLIGIAVISGAVVLGGLTSLGQAYLPEWLSSFSNSAGGWTVLAFLLVWLSRVRPLLGAVLGTAAFLGLNEGYGLVSAWRGFFYAAPFTSMWTAVGVVAGPLLGVSASVARHGRPLWRVLAVTPLCAVLLGEGIWALVALTDTTSPVYWAAEIVLSVLIIVFALWRGGLPLRQNLVVLVVWLAGSGLYVAGWSLLDALMGAG